MAHTLFQHCRSPYFSGGFLVAQGFGILLKQGSHCVLGKDKSKVNWTQDTKH